MDRTTEIAGNVKGGWARATIIVVRVALLVFLLWALVSANFPNDTPVAEDAPPSASDSRTAVDPGSGLPSSLG